MTIKDKLKQKAAPKLAISKSINNTASAIIINESEIDKITRNIQSDLDELRDIYEWWKVKKVQVNDLKKNIIEKLIYVRNEKKRLLGKMNFEDYIVNEIGISKGYFYEQLQAYNVCLEYNRPKLFQEVDHKILVNIAREKSKDKQRNLIEHANELTRDDFKKNKGGKKKASSSVYINSKTMTLSVTNQKALQEIEKLLKKSGYDIEYTAL